MKYRNNGNGSRVTIITMKAAGMCGFSIGVTFVVYYGEDKDIKVMESATFNKQYTEEESYGL